MRSRAKLLFETLELKMKYIVILVVALICSSGCATSKQLAIQDKQIRNFDQQLQALAEKMDSTSADVETLRAAFRQTQTLLRTTMSHVVHLQESLNDEKRSNPDRNSNKTIEGSP